MAFDPLHRRIVIALAVGSALVAAADLALAMGYWALAGVSPTRILQGIAAALLGRERASAGGVATAVLGATIHVLLATTMVVGYWIASRRWRALVERPIRWGLRYGLASWAVMMFVVLPLSALGGSGSADPAWRALHFASHLFIVGLPSALLARRLSVPRAA